MVDFPLNILEENRGVFTDDFMRWLPSNLHVFSEFAKQAKYIKSLGFKHYGARTITEYIRHNTILREKSNSGYKINDHHTPYLARLAELCYSELDGLFQKKVTKKVYENVCSPRND